MAEYLFAGLGGLFFGMGWLYQQYISIKVNESRVDTNFFVFRVVGGIFLIVHFYLVMDILMILLTVAGLGMMLNNIRLGVRANKNK